MRFVRRATVSRGAAAVASFATAILVWAEPEDADRGFKRGMPMQPDDRPLLVLVVTLCATMIRCKARPDWERLGWRHCKGLFRRS